MRIYRYVFFCGLLALAACARNVDPWSHDEYQMSDPEKCMKHNADQMMQTASPLMGGSALGESIAGSFGAVMTAAPCLYLQP